MDLLDGMQRPTATQLAETNARLGTHESKQRPGYVVHRATLAQHRRERTERSRHRVQPIVLNAWPAIVPIEEFLPSVRHVDVLHRAAVEELKRAQ